MAIAVLQKMPGDGFYTWKPAGTITIDGCALPRPARPGSRPRQPLGRCHMNLLRRILTGAFDVGAARDFRIAQEKRNAARTRT